MSTEIGSCDAKTHLPELLREMRSLRKIRVPKRERVEDWIAEGRR